MYQEIANALHDVREFDVMDLFQVAYRSMLKAIDNGLVSDTDDSDDLQLAMCGLISDWIQTQEGFYPREERREKIVILVSLMVDGIWNNILGRSASLVRESQKEIFMSIKAACEKPKELKPMGRPPEGRTERVQALITPKLLELINAQRRQKESMSDLIYRLLTQVTTPGE